VVAIVYLVDTDVDAVLVKDGLAFGYRGYLGFENDAVYCELKDEARSHERGVRSLPPQDRLAPGGGDAASAFGVHRLRARHSRGVPGRDWMGVSR